MVRDRHGATGTAWRAGLAGLVAAGLLLSATLPAEAREAGKTRQYGIAIAPFWEVGEPDPDLTRLCRKGLFNQRANNSLYIGYLGKQNPGRGYTGIAKRGYNLSDPTGQAEPAMTYHFFNDGYSNCKVYVAPDPDPEPGAR